MFRGAEKENATMKGKNWREGSKKGERMKQENETRHMNFMSIKMKCLCIFGVYISKLTFEDP